MYEIIKLTGEDSLEAKAKEYVTAPDEGSPRQNRVPVIRDLFVMNVFQGESPKGSVFRSSGIIIISVSAMNALCSTVGASQAEALLSGPTGPSRYGQVPEPQADVAGAHDRGRKH